MAPGVVIVLNASPPWDGPSAPAADLGARLQRHMLALQGRFFSPDGSGVDFDALRESPDFADYRDCARELQRADLQPLSAPARRCLFLNLYNALTVHAVAAAAAERPLASVAEVPGFWRRFAYDVGGEVFSLDDIEHGVLRGNRPHPSALFSRRFFPAADPRARLRVPLDPRVHFALNCGARSCPPVRVFTEANLERGLALAAAAFLESTVKVDGDVLELSQILKWYGADFGATQREALARVAGYLPEGSEARRRLDALLERSGGGGGGGYGATAAQRAYNCALDAGLGASAMRRGPVRVRWLPYDWSLPNAQRRA